MGDRGQIKVGKVYLYSHWNGVGLPQVLKNVIKRQLRWSDEEYLTRMIFSEMIKDDPHGETNYGIGTDEHGDNEHDLIEVDVTEQTIQIGEKTWSFEEFVAQELVEEGI